MLRFVQIVNATILAILILLPSIVFSAENSDDHKAEIYHSLAEKKAAGLAREIVEHVTLSGLVEIEAGYESVEATSGISTSGSDIVLATAQLGIGVEVTDQITGDLILLYEEEPDSQIEVDEATLNFDNEKYFARVGRQYLPFGTYVSHFISDPMLVDLGETQATAVLGSVRFGSAELAVFIFNGDADKVDDDDHINDYGASLTISTGGILEFGASYLSDLADTGAELVFDDSGPTPTNDYVDRIAGWSAYFVASFDPLEISAEVLAAADSFNVVDFPEESNEPLAWNVEMAWAVADDIELALRVEGSEELIDMPELQYGFCASKGLGDNISLSFEYLHGEFDAFNAPSDTRELVTAQLALEF